MILHAKKLTLGAVLLAMMVTVLALPASALDLWPWDNVAPQSIELGQYATTMAVGEKQQLSPILLPENASGKLSYESSNQQIATVSKKGVVEALSPGNVRIAVTTGEIANYYEIAVLPDPSTLVAEMDLTLSANRISVGDTIQAQVQVLPSNASNLSEIVLSSSDGNVATVNNFGKITGIAPGTATITATCGAVSASAKVTVVASSSGKPTSQRLTVNPSYIVLKPGTTQTLSVSVTPSSASRNFTYKSSDASVAAVSAKGVVTAVGTGSTSIIVSNGTATASVTVIVNQSTTSSSGSSSDNSATQPEQQVQDPVVQAIQDAEKPELTLPQSEVRTLTTEMLNALHDTGRTLYLDAEGYTLRVRGTQVKNATNALNTALSFNPVSNGVEFMLNEGQGMPGKVDILLNEDTASYKRLYLYNENTQKWQYLNSYADGVVEVDTSGRYLLTNETLNTIGVNWYFLGAAGLVLLAIIVVYIVVKKRYWFW